MYDAKKIENEHEQEKMENLNHISISDRSYFNKTRNESFVSTKTSYVPSETIFFQ